MTDKEIDNAVAERLVKAALPKNREDAWTPKHRKNCSVTFQKDGKETRMHIFNYLRYIAGTLPPMQKNGKRIVHFDELKWLHLHGVTKEASQKSVSDYCENIINIYNKWIERMKLEMELGTKSGI